MKKTSYFLLAYFLLSFTTTTAQTTFQKSMGRNGEERFPAIKQTSDGGYIAATTNINSGLYELEVMRMSSSGGLVWSKKYGGTKYEARDVQQTSDGGFIVCGTFEESSSIYRSFLLKLNANGDTLWKRAYISTGGTTFGFGVQQTTDGGYILVGYTNLGLSTGNDAMLIKTDANGNPVWSKTYGGTSDDYGYSVQQTADGGYVLGGMSLFKMYIVKTNSSGSISWSTTFDGPNFQDGQSVRQTTDGGYIIVGTTTSYGAGNDDVFAVKVSSGGALQWAKTYGTASIDYGYGVRQTADGGYAITGSLQLDGILIKTNSTGDTLWTRCYGGMFAEILFNVQTTADGGFVMGGRSQSWNVDGYDAYFVKTDASGNSPCFTFQKPLTVMSVTPVVATPFISTATTATLVSNNITPLNVTMRDSTVCILIGMDEIESEASLEVFPNPFQHEFALRGTAEKGEVIIYNSMGKEMLRHETGDGETKIRTKDLAAGVYLYLYRQENRYAEGRLVKL